MPYYCCCCDHHHYYDVLFWFFTTSFIHQYCTKIMKQVRRTQEGNNSGRLRKLKKHKPNLHTSLQLFPTLIGWKKSVSKQLKTPTLRTKPHFILRAGGIIWGISPGCYEHNPWQPFFIGNWRKMQCTTKGNSQLFKLHTVKFRK